MLLERVMTGLADLFRGGGYYEKYGKMYRKDLLSVPSLQMIQDMASGKVLEVGCGIGYLSRLFSEYVGTDASREGLLIARRNSSSPYVRAAAEALPFRASSFDTVILYDVVEHFHDVPAVLEEAKRVANKVIISLVDFQSYYRLFAFDEFHTADVTVDDLMPSLKGSFGNVRVTRTSGIFSLPRAANEFVGRYFPNQLVIECSR